LPGNRNLGYCRVNVRISTSLHSDENCLASLSLNVAKPPLKGYAGPRRVIFIKHKIIGKNIKTVLFTVF
jgi:hypothetical protein